MTGPIRSIAAGVALLLALSAGNAFAAALVPFTADYQASYMGMQADGRMTLAREAGDRWKYSLSIRNQLADINQSTVFEEHQGRLRPLSGNDRATALVKKRNVDASYDWKSGQATWTGDLKPERRGPVQLQPGDMDALLVNLAVVRDLADGKPLNYRLVDEGRVRPRSDFDQFAARFAQVVARLSQLRPDLGERTIAAD